MKKNILLLFILLVTWGMEGFTQVKEENQDDWINKYYHIKVGNLWFNSTRFAFDDITSTQVKADTIPVYNALDRPMEMYFKSLPPYVKAELHPATLEPGEEGIIVVIYDANKKGTFGPVFEPISLYTNDTIRPEKRLILNPNIQEDFSAWTAEQWADAPKLVFETETFVFDTVATGTKVEYDFVFSNEGKSDLLIRNVKAGCGCTATNPEKTQLRPGESSKIGIIFNTSGRKGHQHKSVTVIANDPAKSATILWIKGYISP